MSDFSGTRWRNLPEAMDLITDDMARDLVPFHGRRAHSDILHDLERLAYDGRQTLLNPVTLEYDRMKLGAVHDLAQMLRLLAEELEHA